MKGPSQNEGMKMTKQHEMVTKGLTEIGAAWAVRSDRYICTNRQCCDYLAGDRRAYHVHPDASYPHQNSIKRFSNLDEVAGYIRACKKARRAAQEYADQFDCPSPEECARINEQANEIAFDIMQDFWASIM